MRNWPQRVTEKELTEKWEQSDLTTSFLTFQKTDIYSVEIHGTKDLEKIDLDDEKYKDLKGKKKGEKKKGKKAEDLKKELELVSILGNTYICCKS